MSEPVIDFEEHGSVDDKLTVDERGGHFNFTVDEPWAGDTITGFGHSGSVALNADQARQLADWIYSRLGASSPIPVYRHPDATADVSPTCVTCGRTYDLTDPDQVAYHDQEGEH